MGEAVAFTNGCFDLLHRGHLTLLEAAKREGDLLIVGLNGDDSVRRLKGDGRPIRSVQERAEALDAVEWVDLVIIFHEDTPLELIRALKPSALVKGGDYDEGDIVGATDVRSWGGRVVRVPLVEGVSTSRLIQAAATGKNPEK